MMDPLIPWYIAGPLLGLIVPLLLVLREKQFGISSSYRYVLSWPFPKVTYFAYNRSADSWQLHFALGLVLAGVIVSWFFPSWKPTTVSSGSEEGWKTISNSVYQLKNAGQFLLGGILVGFGARYANGCTAGHCIMGVSQFAMGSILATISFFIGGHIASNYLITIIFQEMLRFIISLLLGVYFGVVLIFSEAFSWYRIQEMFHFESFHMFGLLFSAISTAAVSIFLLKWRKVNSIYGNQVRTERKPLEWTGNVFGGLIFGVGWGISGACSGPLFVLAGLEWKIGFIGLFGALIGVLIYGCVSQKLK